MHFNFYYVGTRFIQAPLSSPAERQRRLQTICFEAFMEQGVQDPIAAPWLPLEIFQFNNDSNVDLENDNASTINSNTEQEVLLGPAVPPHDKFTAAGEATHGIANSISNITTTADDPLLSKLSATPAAKGSISVPLSVPLIRKSGLGYKDRQQLQHGSMPGPLGAHWSEYYATNKRTPEVTTLAPWVARVYRRRQRLNNISSSGASKP